MDYSKLRAQFKDESEGSSWTAKQEQVSGAAGRVVW